jgi:glyoxylase-like metal-dependent hydrolase (beta-lactamase superfamily II)
LEVAEGVLQLEIPMRHNPLGYTFSYLLADSGTIIDTGVPTGDASKAMEAQLREGGLGVGDLKRIILTHLHRDHVGLVEHIKSASGAEVYASRKAFERQEAMKGLWGDMYSATRRDLEMMGGGAFIQLLSRFEHAFRGSPEPVPIDVALDDGETLRLGSASLRVIWTPGHAPEHICLYDADRLLLFSGDHVLPKITSHVSLHTYEDADPLADYLRSLSKVRDLPVEKVLPGHEHVFTDLVERVGQLKAHHRERCNEVKEALRGGGRTVFQVSSKISWVSSPWPLMSFWTKRMAAAETYAHLVYLRNRGEVEEMLSDGVLYYSLASA